MVTSKITTKFKGYFQVTTDNHWSIALLITLSLSLSIPYLKPGLPLTDDANHLVLRATAFHQAFSDGQLPVRWLPQLNEQHGSPVVNFLYPLPFYIAGLFTQIGITPLLAIKFMFVSFTFFAALGVYFLVKLLTSNKLAAFMASLALITSHYFGVNLYTRGSLGEIMAVSFAIFTLYLVERSNYKNYSANTLTAGLTWAGLILSHNSLAVVFSALIMTRILFKILGKPRRLTQLILAPTLALFISCFFWLPALLELKYTISPTLLVAEGNYFISLHKLPGWISGFEILVLVVSIVLIRKKAFFWILIALIGLLFLLPVVSPVWEVFRMNQWLQFPFRLLSLTIVAGAILTGLLVKHLQQKHKRLELIFLGLFLSLNTVVSLEHAVSVNNQTLDQAFFDTNFGSSTTKGEFSPVWVQTPPSTIPNTLLTISKVENGSQELITNKSNRLEAKLALSEPSSVTINRFYFPGWRLCLNGQSKQNFTLDDTGRPTFFLDKGTHHLVWKLTSTRAQAFSNLVTFLSLISVIYTLYQTRFRNSLKAFALSFLTLVFATGFYWLMIHKNLVTSHLPIAMLTTLAMLSLAVLLIRSKIYK